MTAKAFAYLVKSGGLVGSGGEQLFIEADSQVDNSFTTTTGQNYYAVSPLTIASGVVLTISNETVLDFI
tara:strand:- start:3541 stop:3747 length:207 start_codon:yes stop_codon:yes gene_type:complete